VGSIGSFSAPHLLGSGFDVLTTRIYADQITGAAVRAMAEAVILAALAIAGFSFVVRSESRRRVVGDRAAFWQATTTEPAGERRVLPSLFAALLAALVALPAFVLAWTAFSVDVPGSGWRFTPTLVHFTGLVSDPEIRGPLRTSVSMAALAVTVGTVLAIGIAWVRSRHSGREGRVLGLLAIAPWALPGTVIGVALATALGAGSPLPGGWVLMGTLWVLPVLYLFRLLPALAWTAGFAIRRVTPQLEDASTTLGEPPARTFRRVTLPMILPWAGLAMGGGFVFALGELASPLLVYRHPDRPVSIELLSWFETGERGAVAALGLLLTAMMGICVRRADQLARTNLP